MKKTTTSDVLDLIGVGCGPSNLALAIALEEQEKSRKTLDMLFLDKQADYQWHGNTITSQSELQISFLKDLVSLRNPTSPYTFVNYLQKHGRLLDFINLNTFYPCRMEFSDYLRWVADQFSDQCRYGEEVVSIEPVISNGYIDTLRVLSCDTDGKESVRQARSVVVSAGGTARVPELFKSFAMNERVFHHSTYLSSMAKLSDVTDKPMRVAIIGSGQSAAEAFIDLNDNYPQAKVDMILRSMDLKPADSSPFVNEIFAPEITDLMFGSTPAERERLLTEYHHTNYSVVDIPMIDQIYGILYRQKVSGDARHGFRNSSVVEQATANGEQIELAVRNTRTGEQDVTAYDVVILATGYERKQHLDLLAPLSEYLGDYAVDRNYRVQADERCRTPIYLQGCCEASHGLSDSLLSILATRSEEVATSLHAALDQAAEQVGQESVLEMAE